MSPVLLDELLSAINGVHDGFGVRLHEAPYKWAEDGLTVSGNFFTWHSEMVALPLMSLLSLSITGLFLSAYLEKRDVSKKINFARRETIATCMS
jgi:predicted solute-binding protein